MLTLLIIYTNAHTLSGLFFSVPPIIDNGLSSFIVRGRNIKRHKFMHGKPRLDLAVQPAWFWPYQLFEFQMPIT